MKSYEVMSRDCDGGSEVRGEGRRVSRDEALLGENIKHVSDCGFIKCEGAGDYDGLESSVGPRYGEDGS